MAAGDDAMTSAAGRRGRLVLAALLVAATLIACLGYRDPELMELAGDLLLCR
jgi:hypothetical protein